MLPAFLLLASSFTLTNLSAPVNAERVRHFECFNVVRIIDHATRKNKDAAAITEELTEHCTKLHDPRKAICQALVPSKIANISAQLTEKNRPDVICESLGFARHFSDGRAITLDRCTAIVDLVKRDAPAANADDASPKDSALKLPRPFGKGGGSRLFGFSPACRDVAPDERVVCHVISRMLTRGLTKEIEKDAPSAVVCEKLNAKHLLKLVQANTTTTTTATLANSTVTTP